jgi:hypothetical protein
MKSSKWLVDHFSVQGGLDYFSKPLVQSGPCEQVFRPNTLPKTSNKQFVPLEVFRPTSHSPSLSPPFHPSPSHLSPPSPAYAPNPHGVLQVAPPLKGEAPYPGHHDPERDCTPSVYQAAYDYGNAYFSFDAGTYIINNIHTHV